MEEDASVTTLPRNAARSRQIEAQEDVEFLQSQMAAGGIAPRRNRADRGELAANSGTEEIFRHLLLLAATPQIDMPAPPNQ